MLNRCFKCSEKNMNNGKIAVYNEEKGEKVYADRIECDCDGECTNKTHNVGGFSKCNGHSLKKILVERCPLYLNCAICCGCDNCKVEAGKRFMVIQQDGDELSFCKACDKFVHATEECLSSHDEMPVNAAKRKSDGNREPENKRRKQS